MALTVVARRHWPDLAYAATLALVAAVALIVFAPWRPPGFAMDSWYLMARYGSMGPVDLAGLFVPRAGDWYRPLTGVGYWLTWRLFGLDPTGSFIVQLAGHGVAAVLISAIGGTLTGRRWAALVTGAAFLFALQAHEVVWDHSDLHRVLSAVAVPASVLAYMRDRRGLALAGAIVALLVDEAGVLVLALVGGYELLYRARAPGWRAGLLSAVRRLAPIIVLTLLYAAARLAAGSVYNEVGQPCRSASCLAVGSAEYLNRLAVRGDDLLALLWTQRPVIAIVVAVVLAAMLALAVPWRWPDRRPLVFGVTWAVLGSTLFVLTLWPYVADRFVYVPAMGASLAVGCLVAGMIHAWRGSGGLRRAGLALVAAAVVAWVSIGAVTLLDRGPRWIAASEEAGMLAAELNALLPHPESGTTVLVHDVPHFHQPTFPPGNTGPYVYINGMEWVMRVAYGWPLDVAVPENPRDGPPPAGTVIEFDVVDGHVVRRGAD